MFSSFTTEPGVQTVNVLNTGRAKLSKCLTIKCEFTVTMWNSEAVRKTLKAPENMLWTFA